MASPALAPLVKIITENVKLLESVCQDNGTALPDLQQPFHPSTEAFRGSPQAAQAVNLVVAAAHQLSAILTPPPVALYHVVGGHFKSAAIRVCLESSVTEILREAGPQGLHVNDIAKLNGQDPRKLSRCLRLLAMHHIYREITPDVFTNTRISSLLDTLKPAKAVLADPEHKHDDTMGIAALAGHHLDEAFKASAYSWEAVQDPKKAKSGEPTESGFATAIGKPLTLWQYYDDPSQKFRQSRFDIGMRGINSLQPPEAVLNAYDWKALPAGSLVVDVGGGIGSVSHNILKAFPELKFVVQDLPPVIESGKKYWESNAPDAIKSGQVVLQAHDFFSPQPQKNPALFMIKQIMHDWADEYCVKILKQLRASAGSDTKLLVLESIMPYACHDPAAESGASIPGAVPLEAPAPLLANYGAVNEMGFIADIDMWVLFNSQERTVHHFASLFESTGWKLKVVNRQPGDSTFMQSLEFVPV